MQSVTREGPTPSPFTLTHSDTTHGDAAPWMSLQQAQSGPPEAASGLSAKAIAQMRAAALSARSAIIRTESDESLPQSSEPVTIGEQNAHGPTSPLSTLQTQFDGLRREMEELRAGRFASAELLAEAPPSYAEGEQM